MNWRAQVDGYCERIDPGFWAEPINALTNGVFVLVVLWLWPRGSAGGRMLFAVLAAIGVGSFLFHIYAEIWARITDVVPIAVFVLLYIWHVNRDILGLRYGAAALALAAAVLSLALMAPLFQGMDLGSSSAYAPVALLIALYAAALWLRHRRFARGLALGRGFLRCRSLRGRLMTRFARSCRSVRTGSGICSMHDAGLDDLGARRCAS